MPVNRLLLFFFPLSCTFEKICFLTCPCAELCILLCFVCYRALCPPCAYIGMFVLLCFECAYIE